MRTIWLGVDMGKASFVAAVCADDEVVLGTFGNDPGGFAAMAQQLASCATAAELHLVVEPTSGYELALVAFAYEQSWQVSLPNPRPVRHWAKGMGQRTKTDRQDALLLARDGAACQPAAQAPLAQEVSEFDSLLKRRQDLEQLLQQEKNRLQEMASRPGSAPAGHASLAQVSAALQDALRQVEEALAQHLQHAQLHAEAERLVTIPGIGCKVVLPLLVILHRWHTLTAGMGSPKGLTAFLGLDPKTHVSGTSIWRRAVIAKMGNAEVRRLLYMGALSAVHGRNPLPIFYERLVGRGKPRQVAVGAAAHKLLTWARTLFVRQTAWNPELHPACP
jgi:transposase